MRRVGPAAALAWLTATSALAQPQIADAGLCTAAIARVEQHYGLPKGLMMAIGQVESGRRNPASGRVEPWPWTVQAEGSGILFDTKDAAVRWVQAAIARGLTVIDTGCMQVNVHYHPQAFASLDEAFDPARNADYAARLLLQLFAATGDWGRAMGAYHSGTPSVAAPYRARVEQVMAGGFPLRLAPRPPSLAARLSVAWRATLPPAANASAATADGRGHGWGALLRRRRVQYASRR